MGANGEREMWVCISELFKDTYLFSLQDTLD